MKRKRILAWSLIVAILGMALAGNLMLVGAEPSGLPGLSLLNRQSITGADHEKWVLESVTGSQFRVKNQGTGLYLADREGAAVQAEPSGGDEQVWDFQDHYGVSHFKMKNMGTGRYLTCFGEIKLGAEDGNGTGMVSLSKGDLEAPIAAGELAAGEYYLYNFYGTRPTGDFPAIGCVIVGDLVPLGLSLINRQSVSDDAAQKWVLESVSGTQYRVRNKGTGLYLTDRDGAAAQHSATGGDEQVWDFQDHYGVSHFKMKNMGTGRYLTCFGEIKLGAEDGNGTGMVSLSRGDLAAPIAAGELAAGEYYLYNFYGTQPTGDFPTAGCVIVGERLPMELGLSLANRQSVSGDSREKWQLESVTGTQFRVKNKGTGLYLTDKWGAAIQMAATGTDEQVWDFQDHYGVSHFKMKNLATGRYLTSFGDIKLGAEDGNGTGMVSLSKGDLEAPIAVGELAAGEYYLYNFYGTRPTGDFPAIGCVIVGDLPAGEELGLSLVNRQSATGAAHEKWMLEAAGGSDYRMKNKASGLYLTDKDGTAVQASATGTDVQVWTISDHYTNLWKIQNKATGSYLTCFNEVKLVAEGDMDFGGDKLTSLSAGDLASPITQNELAAGEYYIYNYHHTGAGPNENAPCVLVSEKAVPLEKALELVARGEATGADNEKWLLEPVSGSDYKLKNKATGLYLADNGSGAVQQSATGADDQVWSISDHYTNLWKMQNKGTGSYLTCFNQLKMVAEGDMDFGGDKLVSFAVSDLNTPIAQSGLAAGEFFLYTAHWTGAGDYPTAPCVVISPASPLPPVEGETDYLGLVSRGAVTGADAEKWLLEPVSGSDYRLKNKLTGFYLTEFEGQAVQMEDVDRAIQVWTITDHYGTKWKIQNKETGNYLTCFGAIEMKAPGDYGPEGVELVSLSAGDLESPIDALAAGEYYLYNYYGTRPDGDFPDAACVIVAEQPVVKALSLINRQAVSGDDNEKWILEQVSGNDYRIKNKGSGLYLTDKNNEAVQMSLTGRDSQVWNFADHYGVSHWKVSNKETGNYLITFGNLLLTKTMAGNGWEMVCLSTGDLADPLEASELDEGEFYIYNEYGSRPDGSFPTIACVLAGTDEDELPDDSGLGGDPNERFTLDAGKYYEMTVADYTTADGSASQKWLFEAVEGETGRWRVKNKASGFYLTQINEEIVQQALTADNNQKWELEDQYGLRYTLINLATGKALRLDKGTRPRPGDVDHSSECLVAFQRYASGIQHPGDERASETPVEGVDYYIYNWAYKVVREGVKKGGILTATETEADPGEVVKDEPMPDQDVANDPIEADEAVSVKLVPISSAKKEGSQIWIFREVTIPATPSQLEAMQFGLSSMLPEYPPKLTTGYTIQNKETGLYLTDLGGTLVQLREDGTDEQIWLVENYGLPTDNEFIKIMRNVGSGRQLEIAGTVPGLYGIENYDKDTDTEWPELNKQYGGPVAGVSTVAFARVPSDMTISNIFPENGKGYYIYCGGHGRGASLLEAEGGRVPSQTTELPAADDWKTSSKDFTYAADFSKDILPDNPDWDLLFGGEVLNGVLTGQPLGDTGSYGIGFRHRTSGMGINRMQFALMIPEASIGSVAVALRLNDYMDVEWEQTGLRLYIDKEGRIGLKYVGTSSSVTWRSTGFDFYDYRMVYVEDDTDAGIIRLYFDDDSAKRVLVATITLDDGTATLKPALPADGAEQSAVVKEYGYNLYADGYLSVATLGAYDVEITSMSITIPRYSVLPFLSGQTENPDPVTPGPDNPHTGVAALPMAALAATAAGLAGAAGLTGKRRARRK